MPITEEQPRNIHHYKRLIVHSVFTVIGCQSLSETYTCSSNLPVQKCSVTMSSIMLNCTDSLPCKLLLLILVHAWCTKCGACFSGPLLPPSWTQPFGGLVRDGLQSFSKEHKHLNSLRRVDCLPMFWWHLFWWGRKGKWTILKYKYIIWDSPHMSYLPEFVECLVVSWQIFFL